MIRSPRSLPTSLLAVLAPIAVTADLLFATPLAVGESDGVDDLEVVTEEVVEAAIQPRAVYEGIEWEATVADGAWKLVLYNTSETDCHVDAYVRTMAIAGQAMGRMGPMPTEIASQSFDVVVPASGSLEVPLELTLAAAETYPGWFRNLQFNLAPSANAEVLSTVWVQETLPNWPTMDEANEIGVVTIEEPNTAVLDVLVF